MPSPSLTAILPRQKAALTSKDAERQIQRFLGTVSLTAQRYMQRYPAAQPWKNSPPKRGLRAGGRRTGSYGRGWDTEAAITKTAESITVRNRVPYAVWVGGRRTGDGPGQVATHTARGWPSIEDLPDVVTKQLGNKGLTLSAQ